ncbi:small subunit ribosomal protein S11 [Mycoplasmoides fastidiosum]|uniref:Small ribosomal subunit protein uS11 n=1 Tax=Mycoplasmoides fastidiosum TaxID=92758 RepID=A0ABU0LY47_9BACT|nr:30S ribosomal protein S11 [Mycoplasmoides fastidiosum]MDQ0513610.1 small subunit ribosomal protein S11 [Mycoplasmoides fastidiosum]UUD37967.1 30S ribosomal protein S11 [Mycoplasmoides fastidiosum]
MAKKKKKKLSNPNGFAYIHSTANNTIITLTDEGGNAIVWGSAGTIGYKGTKKATPYAAGLVAEKVGKDAYAMGLKSIGVKVNGTGGGREVAIRALKNVGFTIHEIADVTPLPHNGCRPPKRPR